MYEKNRFRQNFSISWNLSRLEELHYSICFFLNFVIGKNRIYMNSDRIPRIQQMEAIYDRVRTDIATLREYEESGQWLQDYEADERGELPRDLKRGVLSQDGLDEVFEEVRTLPSPSRKYPVITLCGSTRFKEQFLEAQKRLTLAGNIVISVGLFGHSGDEEVWTEGTKEMLDDMHKRKIDMADGIFVINVGGYIGQSTRSEIDYALAHGKKVEFLEKTGPMDGVESEMRVK